MHYVSVLILILQIRTRFCSTGTHICCLSVHKRLGEEGHPCFLLQACGSRTADGKELALHSHRPPRKVQPNQGSAGRGGTKRTRACFPCSPWLISAWRKFMLSLSLRKSAKPAGDRYLREVCRPRRLSLRALGTMRYHRSWARKPLLPPLLLEPHSRPPDR